MLKSGAIWALGAMSGTSLDGVDAAMVLTDGLTISDFGPHAYRPYTALEQSTLRAALGQWPGDPAVQAAAEVVETAHAEVLSRFRGVDVVGFHGQTLAHDPGGRGTHQAGDGALLSNVLGLPVVWDFRSNDVAMGGQGAPLAPFFHHACARWMGATEPLVFLNLGGVGNLTWIDPKIERPEAPGALLAFDTGPANAPVNDLLRMRLGADFDRDGAVASTGTVDEAAVTHFLGHNYFYRMPPKSLDRDAFSSTFRTYDAMTTENAAATLTAIAAAAVAKGLEHCPMPPTRILVTGGGRLNPVLMRELTTRTGLPTAHVESENLNGDMLEAQAFAYLAVRISRGMPTSGPTTTGVATAIGGGRISRPPSPAISG
ncbi:MAG: anhydro-N-acetylmuramic acid kinase [Pseudomonadota bacterium]